MRKLVFTLATLAAAASPLAAQQQPHNHGGGGHDAGTLPAGWQARLDRADANLADVKFVAMNDGFHVTTGPAVILWNPANNVAEGSFTARVTFAQTKAPTHPEAYGIVAGGRNLSGPTAEYFYFLVRGDGKFMLRHRASNGELHTIHDWTEHPAINKQNAQGQATNTVAIVATPSGVIYKVNRTQVAETPGVSGVGQVGLRVNHNLDVHVSNFGVDRRP